MSKFDYDLIVIGAGSGGVRLARWSGGLGAKVAIVEDAEFGGTCVVRGCIPKKMMSLGAHFPDEIEVMKDYGWSVDGVNLDFERFRQVRQKEIHRLSGLYQGMLKKAGVEPIIGRGLVKGPNSVQVGGKTYTTKYIGIAVGGRPWKLEIPGAEHTITSNEAFQLKTVPKSVAVIGTGYIGVEFAGIFNGFGSKVTVVCRRESILTGFDNETRLFLHDQMQAKGIDTVLSSELDRINKLDTGELELSFQDGESLVVDQCLMAVGREPNTESLGLQELGVEMKESNAIIVDDDYQTSVPSIFALGDCTDRMNLTPIATAEAMVLAEKLFSDGNRKMDYTNVPTAVFSDPNLATVGLTEEEAVKLGIEIKIFKSSFRNLKFTLSEGGEKTFMKLIVDSKTDQVLGCHMVGKDAPEIVQGFAVAIKAGAKKSDFDSTIGIHPTSAEEFVTMRG